MANYLGVMTDDYVAQAVAALIAPQIFEAIPTEGSTILLPQTGRDLIVNLSPATNLNAVTLTLPNEASSRMGQRIFVSSTRQITLLTANGIGTVNNGAVMYSPGDNRVFFKNKPNTFSRLVG